MGSRTSLASGSSGNIAAAAAPTVAMSAGLPNAQILQQYEVLDAGLNKVLEYSVKGDADIATDTRVTVGEVKKVWTYRIRISRGWLAHTLGVAGGDVQSAQP